MSMKKTVNMLAEMAGTYKLLLENDPLLRQKAVEWNIEAEKDSFQNCIEAMKYEMRNATGYHKNSALAISCPQVSVPKQGFIMAMPELWKNEGLDKYRSFLYFLNPKVLQTSSKQKLHWEGCLSFPNKIMLVERPEWVSLEFTDLKGYTHRISLDNLVGRVCMHEIDHLDGVLMEDKAKSKVKFSQIEKEEDFMKFVKENMQYLDLLNI